jgi:hydrogenase expression/formation protein HypE
LRIVRDSIPILPETRAICAHFALDPLRLIASGALLLAVPSSDAGRVAHALAERQIPVSDVGEAREAEEGIQMKGPTGWTPLEPADRDEIARVFGVTS